MKKTTKTIIIVLIIAIVLIGWYCYSKTSRLKTIECVDIPNIIDDQVTGTCGILCISGNVGEDSITLTWKADVTFPGDLAFGGLEIRDLWPYTVIPEEQIWAESPTGGLEWMDSLHESHVWVMNVIIYENRIITQHIVDDIIIQESEFKSEDGYETIEEGSHEITGIFYSELMDAEIFVLAETPSIYLVREGDNFYFS